VRSESGVPSILDFILHIIFRIRIYREGNFPHPTPHTSSLMIEIHQWQLHRAAQRTMVDVYICLNERNDNAKNEEPRPFSRVIAVGVRALRTVNVPKYLL